MQKNKSSKGYCHDISNLIFFGFHLHDFSTLNEGLITIRDRCSFKTLLRVVIAQNIICNKLEANQMFNLAMPTLSKIKKLK